MKTYLQRIEEASAPSAGVPEATSQKRFEKCEGRRDKADVNARDKHGLTPLHRAASSGHLEVVKLLVVEFKAGVNARADRGWTPLHVATFYGQLEVVRLLVDVLGADVNAEDGEGEKPIDKARNPRVDRGDQDQIIAILERGASTISIN